MKPIAAFWKLVAVVALFIAGCNSQSLSVGSAQVVAALSAADVVSVRLTVTGSGISAPMVSTLAKVGATWQGMIGQIPAGPSRLFQADALDAGDHVVYSGQATTAIVAHQQAVVSIVLQQVNQPPPFGNTAPVIDSIVLSASTVAPSDSVTATVTAHDADGDPLTYAWSASGGAFNTASAAAVTWTAPASEGSQSLTIQVSDPSGAKAVQTITIQVLASADQGSAQVTVTVNSWPAVSNVSATPTRIDLNQSTALAATAADADGDPINYAWSASCAGTFNDTTLRTPTFTLTAVPAGHSCTLTVIASDGRGGQGTGALTIQAGPGGSQIVAPQIDTTFQSQATAGGGDILTFRVTAHDPQGQALTFAWSANTGALGAPSNAAGSSAISWTAAACGAAVSPVITVTITDTASASTTHTFAVTSLCASCADAIKNGAETDVDCGGPVCGACANGKVCAATTDCASGVCTAGVCVAGSCSDGVKNGSETGVDCGGSCAACPIGQGCAIAADCQSGVCSGGVCTAGSCSDGIKNGTETDIDCGGSCAACASGKACVIAADCASDVCTAGVCAAASCGDGIKNGSETDVDCGGSCPACALGKACAAQADCQSPANAAAACTGGMCTLGACSAGFFNCDASAATGCETPSSNTNCSACGNACGANQTCQNQACVANAWTQVAGIASPVAIAIAPNSFATPYNIYVGTAGNGVFHSSDGATWASAGPATVTSLAAMPQVQNCNASMPDGTVQATSNSGASWAATSGSPGRVINAWYSIPGAGPFGASSNGSGAAQVFQGKSNGATWTPSAAAFGTGVGTGIAFGGGASPTAILYVSVSGSGGGVFKSTNIGATPYSFTSTGFPQTDVLSVATGATALTTVFAGTNGQGAGIYVSTDSGATWTASGTGLGNTVVKALVVDPTNAQNVYAGTAAGIYVSKNGGASWTLSGLAGSSVAQLAVLNGTPNTVYAVTSTGLYVTTTGGQ